MYLNYIRSEGGGARRQNGSFMKGHGNLRGLLTMNIWTEYRVVMFYFSMPSKIKAKLDKLHQSYPQPAGPYRELFFLLSSFFTPLIPVNAFLIPLICR